MTRLPSIISAWKIRESIWLWLCLVLTACGSSQLAQRESDQSQSYRKSPEKLYQIVLAEAQELEGKIIDGWYFGQDSRSLKSGYARSASAVKAQFACDYMKMLADNHQDIEKNFQSYVPYSVREKFARAWWSDPRHSTGLEKESHYKQIIWLHEALMDGSELWWRALERQCPDGVPSSAALAHDWEQQMVSKYKENESSAEKSFSSFAPARDHEKK